VSNDQHLAQDHGPENGPASLPPPQDPEDVHLRRGATAGFSDATSSDTRACAAGYQPSPTVWIVGQLAGRAVFMLVLWLITKLDL
jgi:hypothetical protein